ncbi:VOC family protein [Pedobacter sp. BS3]|uniref:VOC family protein n=1 Tax=Pedobacter sp. BS3 TaxID=2567937 RepID=UPI0011F050F2|nr:VOC family protein [Pedobacter sp. BS3]TZF84476.1 VOC family protein [Pedobacter sp. BS3]
MTSVYAYLTFNGNCREAMTFYQQCLGGELHFQTIAESPLAEKMPSQMKKHILHATLTQETLTIMASDMVSDQGLIRGNTISLMLNCSNEDQIKAYYNCLSAGGEATHPLELTFGGALFGDLTDKFGNNWLLHCNQFKSKK